MKRLRGKPESACARVGPRTESEFLVRNEGLVDAVITETEEPDFVGNAGCDAGGLTMNKLRRFGDDAIGRDGGDLVRGEFREKKVVAVPRPNG